MGNIAYTAIGFIIGVGVGAAVLGGPAAAAAAAVPAGFIAGIAVLMFVGGLVVGRALAPRPKEVRLTGRVFEFPQGPIMVEVALKRMRSIIPVRVTRGES